MTEETAIITCMMRAYCTWKALPRPRSVDALSHVCNSGECEFVQDQCVFICKSTGNLHICTIEMCQFMCDMREYRACSITRTEYPLQLIGQTESDNINYSSSTLMLSGVQETKQADFVATGGKGTGVKTADQARKKRNSRFHKTAVDKDMNTMRATARKVIMGLWGSPSDGKAAIVAAEPELSVALLPFAKSHRQRRGLPQELVTGGPVRRVATSVSTRRFRQRVPVKIEPSTVSDEVIEELQTRCVDMWLRVRGTQVYLAKQHAYDFKYHCLVILYMSMDGFSKGSVVIPFHPLLYETLPKACPVLSACV